MPGPKHRVLARLIGLIRTERGAEIRLSIRFAVFLLFLLPIGSAAGAERILQIGDEATWSFFNGPWRDGPNGMLQVVDGKLREDGPAIQGHHYAFLKDSVYQDFRATFEIRLSGQTDAGLIFHAGAPNQFYLLHFPNCGQASRAQHFWAALSRMDADGYLRVMKLQLLQRVSSTNGVWLPIEAIITGPRVFVRIAESGLFEASDTTYPPRGQLGVYLFGKSDIRNVRIDGREIPKRPWDEAKQPRRTWFHPAPTREEGVWQRPGQLVRTRNGELLLNFAEQKPPFKGPVIPFIIRSTDNGKTFSKPERISILKEDESWFMHVFPDGKLRMMIPGRSNLKAAEGPHIESMTLVETEDGGRTWSDRVPVRVGPLPPGIKRLDISPQGFLNLADGTVLMFSLGLHTSTPEGANVRQWGSVHAQAFVARSQDNGRTWSDWTNLDNPGNDANGKPIGGNLDLTEACAAATARGKIFALIRPIYSPWMWEASSPDTGRTWGPTVPGPFPGYATPNMLRTQFGTILVAHRLPGLAIHTSSDDGVSFDSGTMIDSGVRAMGSMIEIEPNLVLYAYYDSFESLMRAQFIRITLKGIEPANVAAYR